jgi:hypothetical protein
MNLTKLLKQFVTGKHGKVIIWQSPNLLLWLWISIKALVLFIDDGNFKNNLGNLSGAILFAWAFLELTQGDSYFRKLLGLIIITFTTINFF